jgi:prophage DNA circulation protein
MPLPFQPWRAALQPASYMGAQFHVEVGGQGGGRRNALHEYPKRDIPWAEDMGRRAHHWHITGYIIGPDYLAARDDLMAACDAGVSGTLVHPTIGAVTANCDTYLMSESRERGGFCTFEMDFVETGSLNSTGVSTNTQAAANSSASSLGSASSNSLDTSLGAGTIST